jgi:hypothetical protein
MSRSSSSGSRSSSSGSRSSSSGSRSSSSGSRSSSSNYKSSPSYTTNGSSSNNNDVKKNHTNNIPPPQPQQIPQPQHPIKSQESSGFMSNVFQGFSFGLGSSIAHRTIGGLFGNPSNNNNNTSTYPYPNTNSSDNNINSSNYNTDHYQNKTQFNNKITDYTNPNFIPIAGCELLHKEFIDCMRETNSNTHCSISYQIYKDCQDRYKSIELNK